MHICRVYIMHVYAECTDTHTHRQKQTVKQSYAIQFHMDFTIRMSALAALCL